MQFLFLRLDMKKQERGNDGEHNVEKTLNIATPSLYPKIQVEK